jgi:hypothetical protein
MKKIKESEYFKHFAYSRSDLLLIERSPRLYKAKKDGSWDRPETEAFRFGTLIDKAILTPDEYEKEYVEQPTTFDTPSSAAQENFCKLVIAGESEYDAYCKSYSTKSKSDKKISQESSALLASLKQYIEFYKEHGHKKFVSADDAKTLLRIRNNFHTHCRISDLWKLPRLTQLALVYEDLALPLRVLLDVLIRDDENETMYIADLKTTRESLSTFHKSYFNYDYHVQQALYYSVTQAYLAGTKYSGYKIKNLVIACEKKDLCEVGLWEIPENVIQLGSKRLMELFDRALWHDKNNVWDQTREEYTNYIPMLPVPPWIK